MKRLFFQVLLLLVCLTLPASALEMPAPGFQNETILITERGDEDVWPEPSSVIVQEAQPVPLPTAVRKTAEYTQRVSNTGNTLTMVDRISNPKAEPSFAFSEGEDLLEVVFPQIYDCDCALLRCGGETMLVDCGVAEQADRILRMLALLGIERVDKVVNTHPHHDHLGGLEALASRGMVGEFWVCFPDDEVHMDEALSICRRYNVPVMRFGDGDVFQLGKTKIEVWQGNPDNMSVNNRSAQMRVQCGARTMWLAADIERNGILNMAASVPDKSWFVVDILKYPHHGNQAMPYDFYKLMDPQFVVVTSNAKERDGKQFVRRMGTPWTLTTNGLLRMTTDGVTWLLERTNVGEAVPPN